MATPYRTKFPDDTILFVTENGAWFSKGDLLKLKLDDGSYYPYFKSLINQTEGCLSVGRVRAATREEIATLNQSNKAFEEENNMTPFQKAGYTAETIFVRKDGTQLQLNEDDGSKCPYFNYAGTQSYAGVEYLTDLEVLEKEELSESSELPDTSVEATLEGIVVSLQGAREEVTRLEALLKERTTALGITVVVGARSCSESVYGTLYTDGEKMYRELQVGDQVTVEMKDGISQNIDEWVEGKVYTIDRVDVGDSHRPIHFTERSADDTLWIRSELYNVRKVS